MGIYYTQYVLNISRLSTCQLSIINDNTIFCSGKQGREGAGCVSKRGVDDGNQKGGGSFQPAKKSQYHFIITTFFVKPFQLNMKKK
jgi:hypothetical protein